MLRLAAPLLPCLLAALLAPEGGPITVERDLPYSDAGGDGNATRLDLYAPADGSDLPVVIWVHGGAWKIGDKANVHRKPEAFTGRGYLLVSVNYRLAPGVTYRDQGADLAAAIRWVRDHARDHGGSPDRLFLLGHSAGAHLAALVATDDRYLRAEGLDPGVLSGVILLDGAGYDIRRQIKEARLPRLRDLYVEVFTSDPDTQRDASPISHVAEGKGISPFLILYVAGRADALAQSEGLAAKLRESGIDVEAIPARGKTHMTINRELGNPGDEPTRVVFEFLEAQRVPAR